MLLTYLLPVFKIALSFVMLLHDFNINQDNDDKHVSKGITSFKYLLHENKTMDPVPPIFQLILKLQVILPQRHYYGLFETACYTLYFLKWRF